MNWDSLWRAATREDALEVWNASPFFVFMGIRLTEAGKGRARCEVRVGDQHRGGGGTSSVNGGVMAYVFDGVLGTAVATFHRPAPHSTLQLDVSYLRPLEGALLVAEAWVVRGGSRIVFANAEIRDAAGELCATARSIFRIFASLDPQGETS